VFPIAVDCSAGTYVRSLAADLGTALGGGAHLRALRRIAAGSFTIVDAVVLDALDPTRLLPPADALRGMTRVVVDQDVARDVGHGKVLERERLGVDGEGPWAVVDEQSALLAVYEPHRGTTVKPGMVIPRPE
jgi:tRNA pseudouridine55 synthase